MASDATIVLNNTPLTLYLSEADIEARIKTLGETIYQDFGDEPLVLVGVLNGAFMFLTSLAKSIESPNLSVEFVKYRSYEGTQSSGVVTPVLPFTEQIRGKHVLLVEDIIDTGLTLQKLLADAATFNPKSLSVASLLLKPANVQHRFTVPYVGFEIPSDFVVGYGMDYNGLGRNLRHIYTLVKGKIS